jgi:hypothetical protein
VAQREGGSAAAPQFVHGRRIWSVHPHGADGSHRNSPKSRCRGGGQFEPGGSDNESRTGGWELNQS